MRENKKLSRTLLVVCEGDSTEPSYFHTLAGIALDKEIYSYIEIYPTPREIEEEDEREQARNTSRKTRQFTKGKKGVPERTVEEADQDELPFVNKFKGKETWPTPVRYIKEARDRIKEEGYDDAWAVFDMDGHASPDKAYELADIEIEEKKINIAFSAISFEHWILLHFERNDYAFKKSQCKDPITFKSKECGTGVHANDCMGGMCVSGHMIASGHLNDYDKGKPAKLFEILLPLTKTAIQNAAWLRASQNDKLSVSRIWKVNPITNIDALVKKMLGITTDYFWILPTMSLNLGGFHFRLQNNLNGFHLYIENNSGTSVTPKQFTLTLIEKELERPDIKLLKNKKTLIWKLPELEHDNILTLSFSDYIISIYLPTLIKEEIK